MKRFWTYLAAFVLATLLGVLYGFAQDKPFYLLIMVGLLVLFALIWYKTWRRTVPVILTDEERKAPVPDYQDFSNGVAWQDYAYMVVLTYYVFFIDAVSRAFFVTGSMDQALQKIADNAFRLMEVPGFVTIMALLVTISVGMVAWWIVLLTRNKYIIDGDTLIIQENKPFNREEELRIPIDSIDSVEMIGSDFFLYPSLRLKINGVERNLFNHINSIALGKAILQHKNQK
jgi:hypothetical protein